MESLGAKVDWDDEQKAAILDCLGQKYIFRLKEPFGVFAEGSEQPIIKNEWFTMNYKMIDDRIILDNRVMNGFVSLMNANLSIDTSNLLIEINNK